MRLLIHGINYAPEFVGIGKYTTEMAEWFAARGHAVRVHAARPYYPAWETPADYDPARDAETLNGVEVRRHEIFVPKSPSGFKRIRHHVSWLVNSRKALLRSAKEFKPDVLFAVAPSLIGTPAALKAARAVGAKTILHVQDFEVGAAQASGLIKFKSLLKIASLIESALMRRFDYVTTISEAMRQRLDDIGIPNERTWLLRNWVDLGAVTVKSPQESEIRRSLGIVPKACVALYSGTISRKQGLGTVIEAARTLEDQSDLIFLIYGEGPNKAELEARAQGLRNVKFGPFVATERLGDLLAAADIHLLPQIEAAADLVLPSKLTAMLASGRPVIASTPPQSGLADEIQDCGIAVQPGSADALVKAVQELKAAKGLRTALGMKARQRAEAVWCRESILSSFCNKIDEGVPHARAAE